MSTPLRSGPLLALYDVLDFLGQLKDAEETQIWSRIVEKFCVAFDCEAATYFEHLPAKRQLVPRYALGMAAADMKDTAVDLRTGICGWVALHREALIIDDVYKDPRFLREVDQVTGFKTRTILAVPLTDRMDLTGVVELINKKSGPFTPEDLRFVEAACRATSLVLRSFHLESMLAKVTARNASIIENLGGGFLAIDHHGRIIFCNPAARRILELGDEVRPSNPVERALMHVPQLADILLDTLAKRQIVKRQELTWTHKGQTKVLGYSTILIQDPQGDVSGAGVSFQDITAVRGTK